MAMGRPSVFGADKKEWACVLARLGLSRREMAEHLGVAESTIRYALAHDESFADEFAAAQGADRKSVV